MAVPGITQGQALVLPVSWRIWIPVPPEPPAANFWAPPAASLVTLSFKTMSTAPSSSAVLASQLCPLPQADQSHLWQPGWLCLEACDILWCEPLSVSSHTSWLSCTRWAPAVPRGCSGMPHGGCVYLWHYMQFPLWLAINT